MYRERVRKEGRNKEKEDNSRNERKTFENYVSDRVHVNNS